MTDSGSEEKTGFFARWRGIVDKVLNLVQTRLELLGVELQEEKCRLIEALMWASAVVFLGGMSLIVLTFTVIFVVWENYQARVIALIVFSVVYLSAALWSFLMLRKKLKEVSAPFAESLRELKKDRQCLNIRS
ncbi:MAG: phage holin family protein [Verrucomicrobiota bacterium]